MDWTENLREAGIPIDGVRIFGHGTVNTQQVGTGEFELYEASYFDKVARNIEPGGFLELMGCDFLNPDNDGLSEPNPESVRGREQLQKLASEFGIHVGANAGYTEYPAWYQVWKDKHRMLKPEYFEPKKDCK